MIGARNLGLALFGAALATAPASGATAPADFSFTFDTTKPGAAANARLHILYKDPENPDDPQRKSPALTEVIIAAPPGTVFDGSAVPTCDASDAALMQMGRAACPPASSVGGGFGSVVLDPGPPDPFTADVTLLNYGEGIIELFDFLGGAVRVVDRASFEGASTMVLRPAVVPGITEREFGFLYRGTPGEAGKPFITTPPDCPRNGLWTSRLTYTVTTGATYSATGTTPCADSGPRRPAAIRATVRPRRVRARQRVRLRIRLRSSEPGCIAGARVRLSGRRPVRSDRSGRAQITATFRRRGRRTLIASRRGCAPGRATLIVRAPRA